MPIIVASDDWTIDGPKFLSVENLAILRAEEESGGALIVEHRHYRGAAAPTRLVIEATEDLLAYVQRCAKPGDSFWIWGYSSVCRDDNSLVHGKVEDEQGHVPLHGAY